jgi:4'-phosphopantetheinyl transferase
LPPDDADPVLRLDDAAAWLLRDVGRGGRTHYERASQRLTAATGQNVVVAQRPSGRPRLGEGGPELGVSLSWRDGTLLVGYSPRCAVGADIEADDPALDALTLARDHFAAAESRFVEAQPSAPAQRDLFLRLWVAKEAILKATGRGVYDGLDEPDLTPAIDGVRANARPFAFGPTAWVPKGLCVVAAHPDARVGRFYLALARLEP